MSSEARMFFSHNHRPRPPCPNGGNMSGDFGGGMATPFGATQHSPQMGKGYILGGGAAPGGFNSCFGGPGPMHARSFHTGRGCHGWQRGGGGPSPAANYQPSSAPHVPLVNGNNVGMGACSQPQQFYGFVPIPLNWVACEPPNVCVEPPKIFVPQSAAQPENGSYHVNPQGFLNGIKKLVNGFVNPNLNCDFYSDHNRHYNAKYRNNYAMDQRRAEQFSSCPRPNMNNYSKNCNARVKTVIVDLDSEGRSSSGSATTATPTENDHISELSTSPVSATFEFTIFTSDDFPALPAVKKHISPPPSMLSTVLSKVADKLPRARRKARHGKSLSPARQSKQQQKQPKPAHKPTTVGAERTECALAANDALTTPETDITHEDFVVLPKPKINHAINVPVRPVVNVSACTTTAATTTAATTTAATTSNQCQSPATVGDGQVSAPPRLQFLWQRSPRIRQISECSDDSFVICFSEDAQEGVLEVARDSDGDDSDLASDSETETSSDDDGDYDEIDHHHRHCYGRGVTDMGGQFDSGFDEKRDKKVRFNLTPQVHIMRTWNYAYRAARKGDWENFARDRDRFKKRINNVSVVLNPILDSKHRETIYTSRFQCYSKDDDNGAIVTSALNKSNTSPPPPASTLAEEAAPTRTESKETTALH